MKTKKRSWKQPEKSINSQNKLVLGSGGPRCHSGQRHMCLLTTQKSCAVRVTLPKVLSEPHWTGQKGPKSQSQWKPSALTWSFLGAMNSSTASIQRGNRDDPTHTHNIKAQPNDRFYTSAEKGDSSTGCILSKTPWHLKGEGSLSKRNDCRLREKLGNTSFPYQISGWFKELLTIFKNN